LTETSALITLEMSFFKGGSYPDRRWQSANLFGGGTGGIPVPTVQVWMGEEGQWSYPAAGPFRPASM